MFTINIDPIILHIGHFALQWYGLIVGLAVAIGIWLVAREADRKGFPREDIYDSALWVILAGFIGARIFYVLDHWSMEFASNPVRALYFWQGGLVIWGGVIGGLIAVVIIARKKGWRLLKLLDAAAPGIVLAQAVGRVACIITGDVMGKPTDGPFGFAYTNPNARVPELGVYYTPYPVYEIILNLAIFALVWRLRRRGLPDGLLFAVYMTFYSTGRFLLGFVSSYQIVALGMTQSQIVALAAIAVVLPLIAVLRKRQLDAVHG